MSHRLWFSRFTRQSFFQFCIYGKATEIHEINIDGGIKHVLLLSVFVSFFQQDVDALGTLNVQATVVKVKTHVPYYNLKVTPRTS